MAQNYTSLAMIKIWNLQAACCNFAKIEPISDFIWKHLKDREVLLADKKYTTK